MIFSNQNSTTCAILFKVGYCTTEFKFPSCLPPSSKITWWLLQTLQYKASSFQGYKMWITWAWQQLKINDG